MAEKVKVAVKISKRKVNICGSSDGYFEEVSLEGLVGVY